MSDMSWRGIFFACALISLGCSRPGTDSPHVVIYTSVDQPYCAPILAEFERRSGIHVVLKTDAEATKSVGLAERLRAEKDHPQADVWWSNEIFLTINLADEAVLEKYSSQATREHDRSMPGMYRDPQGIWYCNGLRARVIVTAAGTTPIDSVEKFTDRALKGKIAMARPTAGTTGGHVAALYALWGNDRAAAYFRLLHDHDIKLLGGNSVVADSVGGGLFTTGLTDNDDAAAAIHEGGKLVMTLPDQNAFGTLAIPTTIAKIKGAPHSHDAGKLIDYLISEEVEKKLLEAKFIGWSIRTGAPFKAMQIDYRHAARIMPTAIREATTLLEGR
jgi:iron(III) transport system substrate-binding protein